MKDIEVNVSLGIVLGEMFAMKAQKDGKNLSDEVVSILRDKVSSTRTEKSSENPVAIFSAD